ncbi:hypothetical protein NESM_000258200 [Novymonas esmeraldas]|uniref:Uncharacterized protein n=1 Tax=Novymonas esmeraldas TaxID=1808958 RepID=A0AAW0F8M6_9TRYP
MDTRGLRHLKTYLGKDGQRLARAKRAVDVVPVLAARHAVTGAADDSTASTTAGPAGLSPTVMAHLERRLPTGASRKLSRTQMTLVHALAAPGTRSTHADAQRGGSGESALSITRAKVGEMAAAVDALAVAALELSARCAGDAVTGRSPTASEAASLFVLVDGSDEGKDVTAQLRDRYGLTVLLLTDETACRHPTFPSADGHASNTSAAATTSPAAKRQKTRASAPKSAAEASDSAVASGSSAAAVVVVVVATPAAFLAVDRRSAIWKFIGSCALLLRRAPSHTNSLLSAVKGGADVSPAALNAQRWDCLGHVAAIAVVAAEQAWLTEPELDLLTTLRVEGGAGKVDAPATKSGVHPVTKAVAASRAPVTVHYAVAQGTHRFQFLFGLLKGLAVHRGLVVHVATRECVAFLYDALYSLLDELPPHLQLFSDYEGASAFTKMHSSADRLRLCAAFDAIVKSGKGDKTAAVLVSCHGLVPSCGSLFLQYDIIPDVLNYNQFIADVLTPGAAASSFSASSSSSTVAGRSGGDVLSSSSAAEVAVRRETTTRQRKRSVSPTPASRRASAADAEPVPAPVLYTHILLLLRPNEVAGALRRLRQDAASRYRLEFRELGAHAGGRYLFIGEKLKSMNKKLFAIQNAAYYAYKETMRVYSTIGPRDVYDETKVSLDKVAEEFGYTELPLLDLRLKDTVFRPKEDFYRAARQKQEVDRRAYKKFAQDNIEGEAPEEHIPDVVA